MRHRPLLVVGVLLSIALAHGFVPGAVCEGVDSSGLANTLLVGKHLRVLELEGFLEFAEKDPQAEYGWSGLNVELLKRVIS